MSLRALRKPQGVNSLELESLHLQRPPDLSQAGSQRTARSRGETCRMQGMRKG